MKKQDKIFLKSNWLRLSSANYIIEPSILDKYLPKNTILESHNNKYYISLVAFRYCDTRILNFRIPFYNIFEEINLRFYIKREINPGEWRSEVAFTKLFFPKKALTFVAKTLYKENYETAKIDHKWEANENELITNYKLKKEDWNNFEIISGKEAFTVDENTDEHFFSKHFWGTSKINSNSSTIYEIQHPTWKAFEIFDYTISFDFENVFGPEFSHLKFENPDSVQLYDGSEVVVYKKSII